jgi:polar amino acid transport system substrate-binding protein
MDVNWDPPPLNQIVRVLSLAADVKGTYMPGHGDGVAYLAQIMAHELDWDVDRIERLTYAAVVHDIGKLLIPDHILLADRKLTDTEYEVVKGHSQYGEMIVERIRGFEFAAPWIRSHHERFDGTGYPDGLVADEIPLESRIIFLADACHVMTVDRPYMSGRTRDEALDEAERNAGTQFDPMLVEVMLTTRHRGRNP